MALSPDAYKAASDAINKAERLLIIPHANVDPDGLSSALACYSVFKALGKDCTVICPESTPESLKFLPNASVLAHDIVEGQNFVITLDCSGGVEVDKLRYAVEDNKVNIIVVPKKGKLKRENVQILDTPSAFDLIVVVDSAELALLGSLYTDHVDLFSDVPILNVDHHISNTQFGQVTLIDPTCASATQVLYQWFMTEESMRKQLNADIATLLLTGLITDTRSFQNPNTTPKSLEVAAELLERGARQQEIIKHIYKTKPLSTLKIWGRALNKIQYDAPSRFVWSTISLDDLKEMNASSKETTGILDELISTIPNADVYILFTELEGGGFKASVRSSPAVDVNRLTGRTFGGGGHARAAGFSIKEPGNFQLQVLEAVQKLKEGVKDDQISENRAQPTPMTVPKPVVPMVTEDIPSVSKKETKDIDIVDLLEEKDGTTEKEGKKNGQAKKK